jgi:hypothetical protein
MVFSYYLIKSELIIYYYIILSSYTFPRQRLVSQTMSGQEVFMRGLYELCTGANKIIVSYIWPNGNQTMNYFGVILSINGIGCYRTSVGGVVSVKV